jgi:Domain of unknown function (DUF397)
MSSIDLSGALWRKSSYSNGQANCVEVATIAGGRTLVAVRDSTTPDSPGLIFAARVWRQFTDSVTLNGSETDHIRLAMSFPSRYNQSQSVIRYVSDTSSQEPQIAESARAEIIPSGISGCAQINQSVLPKPRSRSSPLPLEPGAGDAARDHKR